MKTIDIDVLMEQARNIATALSAQTDKMLLEGATNTGVMLCAHLMSYESLRATMKLVSDDSKGFEEAVRNMEQGMRAKMEAQATDDPHIKMLSELFKRLTKPKDTEVQ